MKASTMALWVRAFSLSSLVSDITTQSVMKASTVTLWVRTLSLRSLISEIIMHLQVMVASTVALWGRRCCACAQGRVPLWAASPWM